MNFENKYLKKKLKIKLRSNVVSIVISYHFITTIKFYIDEYYSLIFLNIF